MTNPTNAAPTPDAADPPDVAGPSGPSIVAPPPSFDRFAPGLAVAAMIGTFVAIPAPFAMTLIAVIWLVGTRLFHRRSLLGLTLTQALAWTATIVISEFLAALILYVAVPGAAP